MRCADGRHYAVFNLGDWLKRLNARCSGRSSTSALHAAIRAKVQNGSSGAFIHLLLFEGPTRHVCMKLAVSLNSCTFRTTVNQLAYAIVKAVCTCVSVSLSVRVCICGYVRVECVCKEVYIYIYIFIYMGCSQAASNVDA